MPRGGAAFFDNLTNSSQEPFTFVKLGQLCQTQGFRTTLNEKIIEEMTMKIEKRGLLAAAPLDGNTVIAARTIQHNPLFGGAHV